MRTIERSTKFRKDYKRESKGRYAQTLDAELTAVLRALIQDEMLHASFRDHDLSGDWSGYRDCHIKPDLLLIYQKPDASTLRLICLGSHSELLG